MKNLMKILTGILVLSLILVSCKKDKDKDTVSNYFKVNETTYKMSEGILENWGTSESYEGYNLDLTLISDGISIDADDNWSGSGKAIYFEMYSTSSTYLPSGAYDYDDETSPSPTFSFDWSFYVLDLVLPDEGTMHEIISGTVTIVRDGSTYEITITGCEDGSGNTITAHFSGTLTYFDLSDNKSTKNKF
jgi:hypothetical protein